MGRRGRGRQPKQRMVQLWQAPAVESLGRELVEAHHQHLQGKPLVFAFAPKSLKVRGRPAAGRAEIISGKAAAFAAGLPEQAGPQDAEERFFLITIAYPVWVNLSDARKRALVDHELCHCGLTEKGGLTIWPHDVEEFRAIIDRHGLWEPGVEKFAESVSAAAQMSLDLRTDASRNGRNGHHAVEALDAKLSAAGR